MPAVFDKFLNKISDPLTLFMLLVITALYFMYTKELSRRDIVIEELKKASNSLIKLTTLIEVLTNKGGRHD